MSKSTLHDIPQNTLRAGPRLQIRRDGKGTTTASLDFTCRKFDIDNGTIRGKLTKGTSIKDLYPEIGPYWWFLYVDSWTSQDEPGGITTVSVEFIGPDVADGEFTFDGAITYTRNNSLADRPSLSHPQFLVDTESFKFVREIFKLAIQGVYSMTNAGGDPGNDYVIVKVATGTPTGQTISDSKVKKWWDFIVTEGNVTYDAPSSEWTKNATGRGTLTNGDLADFGYIDDNPDGNPGTPDGMTWRFSGATESISFGGTDANSYSKTWQLGVWPEIVYKKPS